MLSCSFYVPKIYFKVQSVVHCKKRFENNLYLDITLHRYIFQILNTDLDELIKYCGSQSA